MLFSGRLHSFRKVGLSLRPRSDRGRIHPNKRARFLECKSTPASCHYFVRYLVGKYLPPILGLFNRCVWSHANVIHK